MNERKEKQTKKNVVNNQLKMREHKRAKQNIETERCLEHTHLWDLTLSEWLWMKVTDNKIMTRKIEKK